MGLKPEFSVATGLATATLVYGVYQAALPSVADVRSIEAQNDDLLKAEKGAAWISAGIVAGISLLAKDPTVFIIGGTAVVAISWFHRHANSVNPVTGKVLGRSDGSVKDMAPRQSQADSPQEYSTPTANAYEPTF